MKLLLPLRTLLFALRLLAVVLHLLLGVVLGIVFVWRPDGPRFRQQNALIRWWLGSLARVMGCSTQLHGDKKAMPSGCLVISNHISWLDILVLGGALGTRFLSKQEVRNWPVVGWLSTLNGTLFISRGSGAAKGVADIQAALHQGDRILMFPEGTTSLGDHIKPFHPRMLKSAIDVAAPIQPVLLTYPKKSNGLKQPNTAIGWPLERPMSQTLWALLSRWRSEAVITLLPPVQTTTDMPRKDLAKQLHQNATATLEQHYRN